MYNNYKSIERTGNITPYLITSLVVIGIGFVILHHLVGAA